MIRFEIPDVPPLLLNSRLHWRSVHSKRTVWYGLVLGAVHKQRPPRPFERAAVRYLRMSGNKNQQPDHDNLVSSFKWIQDTLIYCGILAGDGPAHIEAVYDWQPAPRKGKTLLKRVAVEIEPIF
jgi:hypothetical protein